MSNAGNPLAAVCPCGHAAYHHRTQEQIEANRTLGRRYVGECTGRGPGRVCCECQAERSQVIAAAQVAAQSVPS